MALTDEVRRNKRAAERRNRELAQLKKQVRSFHALAHAIRTWFHSQQPIEKREGTRQFRNEATHPSVDPNHGRKNVSAMAILWGLVCKEIMMLQYIV